MYLWVPHLVAETCRNLADTSINAAWLSRNAPTTLVLRRASFNSRSIGLLVLILSQCCGGYAKNVNVSPTALSTNAAAVRSFIVFSVWITSWAFLCAAARFSWAFSMAVTARVIQDTHKSDRCIRESNHGKPAAICDKSHKRREKICGQVQGVYLY